MGKCTTAKVGGLLLACVVCFGGVKVAEACSSFSLVPAELIHGKSYDWHINNGDMTINKRNVAKESLIIRAADSPAKWTSKFGSLTFNQYGREFPNGGLNEKGLVIEILWLNKTKYPAADARESVNELQWIQYMLDNYETVEDIVKYADRLRISAVYAKVHFFACDSKGECGVFEYLNGKFESYSKNTLKYRALTNNPYAEAARAMKNYKPFGGSQPIPTKGYSSTSRFARLAAGASQVSTQLTRDQKVKKGFDILNTVFGKGKTASQWQIIYDAKNLKVYYQNVGKKLERQEIDLKKFDYSCKTAVKTLDMQAKLKGDVTAKFADYDAAQNLKTVTSSLTALKIPRQLVNFVAGYPETTNCTEN